ncbi:hypothetical protein GCM10009844_32900 [Nocardioides koreensis]|uniref:Uncharacterized protein n=1 Tax=Nocardioides koreensis TaxID=433651 RepID=A0ABN3A011_9ACTN
MSELHGPSGGGASADAWLTPTVAAIAGFTIAVLSLLTNGAWVLALQSFIARDGSNAFEDVVMATGVTQGLLAVTALVLGRRGLASTAVTARNLGGATAVLGVLGLVVAFLTVVAGLIAAT